MKFAIKAIWQYPLYLRHVATLPWEIKHSNFQIFYFLRCFGKTTPYVKFSKFCSESFHRDLDRRVVFKFRENWPTVNRWNRALLTWQKKKQNFAWFSSCRYCSDGAQNMPEPAPDSVLRVHQISSKSVQFRRSYSRTREHRPNAP